MGQDSSCSPVYDALLSRQSKNSMFYNKKNLSGGDTFLIEVRLIQGKMGCLESIRHLDHKTLLFEIEVGPISQL